MTIDVATGIARILKQEGVEWVSTFPVCRVNNALGREGVPMVMMRDDRYAVAVADAYSRITAGNRIGVCTFQGGVNAAGMQYAYAGMAQAFEDGSPVLCITDGVPIGSSGNSQFDVASSMKTVSKWFGYVDQPDRVPEFMRRAFTMLRSGRPGPVILAIPNPTGTYDETADPYYPVKGWKAAPDPTDVSLAVDLLLKAENPLVYAGEGVIYAGAAQELLAFAEAANTPVVTTLKAKGAFPENHPLFVGVRGDQVTNYLNKSDLILAVGSVFPRAVSATPFQTPQVRPSSIATLTSFTLTRLLDGPGGDRRCQVYAAGSGQRGFQPWGRPPSAHRGRGVGSQGRAGRGHGPIPGSHGIQ